MRLLRVVDEREEERAKARSRYVELMKAHIEQQLKQFVEREKRLRKRKEAKEKRAKVEMTFQYLKCYIFCNYVVSKKTS